MEIKLTGCCSTASPRGPSPSTGTLVAPLVTPVHQPCFVSLLLLASSTDPLSFGARLDMAVGATRTASGGGRETAFRGTRTHGATYSLSREGPKTEKEAQDADASVARTWRIFNGSRTNGVSKKTMGYKLVPFVFGPAQPARRHTRIPWSPSAASSPPSPCGSPGTGRVRGGRRGLHRSLDGREGRAVERWAEGDRHEGQDLVVHTVRVCRS